MNFTKRTFSLEGLVAWFAPQDRILPGRACRAAPATVTPSGGPAHSFRRKQKQ